MNILGINFSSSFRSFGNVFAAGPDADHVAVLKRLSSDMQRIFGAELLEIIKHRAELSEEVTNKAVATFLSTDQALANLKTSQQLDIVIALGLSRMHEMFDKNVGYLRNVFAAATHEQRRVLFSKDLMDFFTRPGAERHWYIANRDMLEYLSDLFVGSLEEYAATVDSDFARHLIDNYGLAKAFNRSTFSRERGEHVFDNQKFIALTDHASDAGIRKLLKEAKGEAASAERLGEIEWQLYLKDKAALNVFVEAKGCYNEGVERYLLEIGELPTAVIRRCFVQPGNFSLLKQKFSHEEILEMFPAKLKKSMPCLWKWIEANMEPDDFEDINAEERVYLLNDDELCLMYINQGGRFSESDIEVLTWSGKTHIVAASRGK